MTSWYKSDPEALTKLKESIAVEYSDLRVVEDDDPIQVKGSFPVKVNGKRLDRYSIRIEIPDDYPDSIPVVYEVGGRIPWTPDRHVNKDDHGAACLFLPEERSKYFPQGRSFLDFLKGPVNDYFLNQLSFELTGTWVSTPRGHGRDGIIEFYKEELGISNPKAIKLAIDYLTYDSIQRQWICFCGSGKKLRKCHRNKLLNLHEKVPPKVARNTLNKFFKPQPPKQAI